jgi:hypothetical protein
MVVQLELLSLLPLHVIASPVSFAQAESLLSVQLAHLRVYLASPALPLPPPQLNRVAPAVLKVVRFLPGICYLLSM